MESIPACSANPRPKPSSTRAEVFLAVASPRNLITPCRACRRSKSHLSHSTTTSWRSSLALCRSRCRSPRRRWRGGKECVPRDLDVQGDRLWRLGVSEQLSCGLRGERGWFHHVHQLDCLVPVLCGQRLRPGRELRSHPPDPRRGECLP